MNNWCWWICLNDDDDDDDVKITILGGGADQLVTSNSCSDFRKSRHLHISLSNHMVLLLLDMMSIKICCEILENSKAHLDVVAVKSEEAINCSHSPSSLFALDCIFTYSENYDEKQDTEEINNISFCFGSHLFLMILMMIGSLDIIWISQVHFDLFWAGKKYIALQKWYLVQVETNFEVHNCAQLFKFHIKIKKSHCTVAQLNLRFQITQKLKLHFILVWTRRGRRQPLQPFRCCRGFTPSILIILILILITLSILTTNIYQCSPIFSFFHIMIIVYLYSMNVLQGCFSKSLLNTDMQNVKCIRICPRKAPSIVFTLSLIIPPPNHITNRPFF